MTYWDGADMSFLSQYKFIKKGLQLAESVL